MIRFTVVWEEDTIGELARLWGEAEDRQKITVAGDAIDEKLAVDAHLQGLELAEGLKVCSFAPLRVYFSVSMNDRLVQVWSVKLQR